MKFFGLNSTLHQADSLADFVKDFAVNGRDLIITSKGMYQRQFEDLNLEANFLFHDTYGKGEPTDVKIDALLKDASAMAFDRVIAVGGGSVLDIAKLFVLKDLVHAEDAFTRSMDLVKDKQLVCVPTTCGTGSEVTNITIAELTKKGTKMGLADPVLYPDEAVLIPGLLIDLPYKSFLYSAADALIHATESWVSPKANAMTRLLSAEAIESILDVFTLLDRYGEEERYMHLGDMLLASTMAGIAFGNTGVGAVHALSYPLGGTYHVAHGEANTQFFSRVFEVYDQKDPGGAMAALKELIAVCLDCSDEEALTELKKLLERLVGIQALSTYGMKEADIEAFADSVMESQQRLLANNYVALSRDEIRDIYKDLF